MELLGLTSVAAGGEVVNVAVTLRAWIMVTVQLRPSLLRTGQAPPSTLQPAKVESASGVAVRVTGVPTSKTALHIAPQSSRVGVEVIVPMPVPVLMTVKRFVGTADEMLTLSNQAVPSPTERVR